MNLLLLIILLLILFGGGFGYYGYSRYGYGGGFGGGLGVIVVILLIWYLLRGAFAEMFDHEIKQHIDILRDRSIDYEWTRSNGGRHSAI